MSEKLHLKIMSRHAFNYVAPVTLLIAMLFSTSSLTAQVSSSVSMKYESEDGELSGDAVSMQTYSYDTNNDLSDYSGTGFLAYGRETSDKKTTITVNAVEAGDYPLLVRYAHIEDANGPVTWNTEGGSKVLYDDGTWSVPDLNLNYTNVGLYSWTDTTTANGVPAMVTLREGVNQIELWQNWGGVAIDYIIVGDTALLSTGAVNENEISSVLYPNPVSNGSVSIAFKDNVQNLNYELYNVVGKLVKSGKETVRNNKVELSTQSLNSGYYILKMTADGNRSIVKKLIVK